MIKAIVFDVGGVLYHEDFAFYDEIATHFQFDPALFAQFRQPLILKFSQGKLTTNQFLKLIAQRFGIKDLTHLRSVWIARRAAHLRPDRGVLTLLKRLQKQYKLVSFTNITPLHHSVRMKKHVYQYFEKNILSFEAGYRKPQLQFYRYLLKSIPFEPIEILFIDDYPENLLPAQKLGLKTILFKNASQLQRDLKRLGLQF